MRNILITGSSSGIGLATAVELARRGENVYASMRDLSRSGPLRAALDGAMARATLIQMDVTDSRSVDTAVRAVEGESGEIDVLLNNAGVTIVGPLEQTSDEEMLRVFDTNVFGVHRTIRAVLPGMRRAGHGRIVNISSAAARPKFGIRLWSAYGASKAALSALSLELVKEVAPFGIEVVLLEAGVSAQTPVWERARAQAAPFGAEDSPYGLAGKLAVAQIAAASSGPDQLSAAVAMIADACTTNQPALRFPADRNAVLDSVDGIADEAFVRLSRGDVDPGLYQGVPGFWGLQQSVLSS